MLTRTLFAMVLFAVLKYCHAQPLPVISVSAPSASGLNTCPTPNYTFGTSNVIWVEASTVSPQDGSPITTVPNLVCSPAITVNGTFRYYPTGGGPTNLSRVVGTNNLSRLSGNAQIINSSNYTVMVVMKVLPQNNINTALDVFRGCNGSTGSADNGAVQINGSGNPTQMIMQGNGAGFINPNFTDTANYHVFTFIQSNNIAILRWDKTFKSSGSVVNTADWGGLADHSWNFFGENFGSLHLNCEWTRGLMWTNPLSASDVATWENKCASDFGL